MFATGLGEMKYESYAGSHTVGESCIIQQTGDKGKEAHVKAKSIRDNQNTTK
jgi:hypothetical protein